MNEIHGITPANTETEKDSTQQFQKDLVEMKKEIQSLREIVQGLKKQQKQ